MQQVNQTAQPTIMVDNFIKLSNQSIISPEIVFVNKPITINKKKYFKLFINLNYNPNIVKKEEMLFKTSFDNLDFKIFSNQELKEIKSVNKISSNLIINNNLSSRINEIEYNIPYDLLEDENIKVLFGLSYLKNSIVYEGKGEINISVPKNNSLNFDQNLVSYFSNYDFYSNKSNLTSKNILKAKVNIEIPELKVTKEYDDLGEIKITFVEDIPSELINNSKIIDFIIQIKNHKIFPHFVIRSASLTNIDDTNKHYDGQYNFDVFYENNSRFYIKNKSNLLLNKQTRKITITNSPSYSKLFFSPFSWADNQSLKLEIICFGENITYNLKIHTLLDFFSWNQDKAFEFKSESKYTYSFISKFWKDLFVLTDEEIIESLVKYEK